MADTDLTAKRSGRGLGWLIVTLLIITAGVTGMLYWNGFLGPSQAELDADLPPVIIEAD